MDDAGYFNRMKQDRQLVHLQCLWQLCYKELPAVPHLLCVQRSQSTLLHMKRKKAFQGFYNVSHSGYCHPSRLQTLALEVKCDLPASELFHSKCFKRFSWLDWVIANDVPWWRKLLFSMSLLADLIGLIQLNWGIRIESNGLVELGCICKWFRWLTHNGSQCTIWACQVKAGASF